MWPFSADEENVNFSIEFIYAEYSLFVFIWKNFFLALPLLQLVHFKKSIMVASKNNAFELEFLSKSNSIWFSLGWDPYCVCGVMEKLRRGYFSVKNLLTSINIFNNNPMLMWNRIFFNEASDQVLMKFWFFPPFMIIFLRSSTSWFIFTFCTLCQLLSLNDDEAAFKVLFFDSLLPAEVEIFCPQL